MPQTHHVVIIWGINVKYRSRFFGPMYFFRTTKMCTTHVSGVGDCVDLSRDGDFCDDRDEMKVVYMPALKP